MPVKRTVGGTARDLFCADWIFDGDDLKRDWAFVVQDGLVESTGSLADLGRRYPDAVPHKREWLVTPAFTDAHDHGRGVSPAAFGVADQALELWVTQLSRTGCDPYAAALYDGLRLARSGVGTVVHSHNPCQWDKMSAELIETVLGYNEAGIRVAVCPPFVDQNSVIYHGREGFAASLPPGQRKEFAQMINDCPLPLERYLDLVEGLCDALRPQINSGMADVQLHPAGGQWCGDGALQVIGDYGAAKGLRIHMHLLETRYQRIFAKKTWGKTFIRHYAETGILGPWLTLAHMTWADRDDMALLSESGAGIVVNASSNMRLYSGSPPLRAALDASVPCGIGLDGCAVDDDQDFIREMRMARLHVASQGVNARVGEEEALRMATRGGAAATGYKLSPGCLSPGLPADFACFDKNTLEFPYTADDIAPHDLLLLRGTSESVCGLYINGNQVFKEKSGLNNRLNRAGKALNRAIRDRGAAGQGASPELLEQMRRFYESWE